MVDKLSYTEFHFVNHKQAMKTNIKTTGVVTQAIILCFSQSPRKSASLKKTSVAKKAGTVIAAGAEKTDAKAVADKGASSVPLTLIIKNLASPTAPITVGVYGTKNKFPDPKDQLKEYKFKPHGKVLTAKISDLKFGTYALALYQDVNSNGKIDKNFIGIPKEPYAFSNNFKPKLKAPDFDDCKFDYSAKANKLTMSMIK